MAVLIDSDKGRNYSENVLSSVLNFESGTWTVSSGTGTVTRDENEYFSGNHSLKLENTTPVNDLIASNSNQNSVIKNTGKYQLSWYCLKSDALDVINGRVIVYKNAAFLNTQNFTLGSTDSELDIDQKWQRFQSNIEYDLIADDVITFQFVIDGMAAVKGIKSLWIDGVMLNKASRQNITAPLYNPPNKIVKEITQIAEPIAQDNTSILWNASTSGTKDGTAYEQGDVLITVNSAGVSKTVLIVDYSAV